MTHPPRQRPATVTIVVVLVWISAAVALTAGAIMIGAALTRGGTPVAVVAALALGAVLVVVSIGISAVASRLARGGNGARTVISALQIIQIVAALASLTAHSATLTATVTGGGVALNIAILALLWNHHANPFFRGVVRTSSEA